MAIGYIKRVAGPFTGAGTTSLPFGFLVYKPQDVYVALAASDIAEATNLEYGTDYTVVLNADQETSPGGTVTLTTALAEGQVAAVGSALDYTQPTQLTNFSRFPPEIINDALDRIVILIQQLLERLERTVTVPVTSSQTPEELVESLQKAAESAEKVASAYAAQAGTSAASAAASAKKAQDAVEGLESTEAELETKLQDEAVKQKATVTAEGTKQTGLVTAEGTKQLGLIQDKVEYIETIAPSKADVETVADNITSINAVAPHADDLTEIVEHIDEVHTVGQDLQGVNATSLDLGSVADTPDAVTTVTDGYIKKVAEHIDDCVHPVSLHIGAIEAVAENLTPVDNVSAIISTDYASIFKNGV